MVRLSLIALISIIPQHLNAQETKAIEYLRRLETKSGGFRMTASAKLSSLRATTAALRALRIFGGQSKDQQPQIDFLKKCFDPETGGFKDHPSSKSPDVFTTAVGLMAMSHFRLKTSVIDPSKPLAYLGKHAKSLEDIRIVAGGIEAAGQSIPIATKWREQVQAMPLNKKDARQTASVVMTILRLGGKVKNPNALIIQLQGAQLPDGGFGMPQATQSDLGTTYRVMRAFAMLKGKPARPEKLKKFVAGCQNMDGGYGVTQTAPSTTIATYFAAKALHWLK